MDQINNNTAPEEQEVIASEEHLMSPEQLAEMEALKNQDLYGNHVKKIGECAVVTVEDETVALELPITYPQLLTALIKRKYNADQFEAITANFLTARTQEISEAKAAEYTTEYETYRAWRNKCKAVAKEVVGITEA